MLEWKGMEFMLECLSLILVSGELAIFLKKLLKIYIFIIDATIGQEWVGSRRLMYKDQVMDNMKTKNAPSKYLV